VKGFLGAFLRQEASDPRARRLVDEGEVSPTSPVVSDPDVGPSVVVPLTDPVSVVPALAWPHGWDVLRAAAVVAQVNVLIDAALAQRGVAVIPSRRQILTNERLIVRGLELNHDPYLWEWPEALSNLLARWARWDTSGVK
jgi:hypothetical protein